MSTSFNFPANPTLNQIVVLPDGNSAQWNGTAWVSVANNVTYPLAIASGGTGATNPSTARINLGLNTATGEFIADKDGTVAAPGIAFASQPDLGFFRRVASEIGVAAQGQQIAQMNGATATASYLTVYPRAAGFSQLTLEDTPFGASGAKHQFAMSCAASGYELKEATLNGATNLPLNLKFDAGVLISVAGTNVVQLTTAAAATYLSCFPRTANATAQLTLFDQPAAAASFRQLFIANQSTGYVFGETLVGGATPARKLSMLFPAGIDTSGPLGVAGDLSLGGVITFNGAGQIQLQSGNGFPVIKFNSASDQLVVVSSSHDLVYQVQGPTRNLLTIGGAAGDMTILGNTATKNSGTTWANPSSRSIKHDINDYALGLPELLRVRPRTYRLNDAPERLCVGIVADEMEPALPQSITYDDKGAPLFQADPVIWALVNSVKTLHQRLEAIGA